MRKHFFVVQTNAVPGRETDFNDWYTNVHIPDALAVPGFPAAQRFRLSETQRSGAGPYSFKYLTVYDVEGDPAAALSELGRAVPSMYISDAMADERQLHLFEARTERIQA